MNITIKTEWLEAAKTLQNPFEFIEAIASYIQTGIVPDIAAEARGMFIIIQKEIDARKSAANRVHKCRQSRSITKTLQDVTGRYSNVTETQRNVTEKAKEKSPTPPKENTKKTGTKVPAKESETLSFEDLIPPSLKTPEFEIAWDQWCKFRRATRHTITRETARRQLATLGRYPPGVAIAAIDQSIEQGWQGLFPDKTTIKIKPQRDYTGI